MQTCMAHPKPEMQCGKEGMRMKVAYQPGLEAMARSLSGMGFDMLAPGSAQEADAAIFAGDAARGARRAAAQRARHVCRTGGGSAAQAEPVAAVLTGANTKKLRRVEEKPRRTKNIYAFIR